MKDEKELILREVIQSIVPLSEENLSEGGQYWRSREIKKGDFFNRQNVVCKDLGIVLNGIFRVYYIDPNSKEEKNVFFFSEKQFIVSFRSFIYQYPCNYFIEALEDSEIIYIRHADLQLLYDRSKEWERFGRLLAERFFNYSQSRAEELLFLTHEERYLLLQQEQASIFNRIHSYHLASYLGIKMPSLSRIRRRLSS